MIGVFNQLFFLFHFLVYLEVDLFEMIPFIFPFLLRIVRSLFLFLLFSLFFSRMM
jgi:hypothetical protein